jgi:hypothetical protein
MDLKELLKHYYTAYGYSQKLPKLREELINEIKKGGLKGASFEVGKSKIVYREYEDNEGLTQKLIRQVLTTHYPGIDPNKFITTLCSSRKKRLVETLKVTALPPPPETN